MARICKVLVVEDNDEIRQLLGNVFHHEGYHFVMAGDARGMRQVLTAHPDVDVVILDVRLPGSENGLSLAKELAGKSYGVILVTGDHRHADRLEMSGHRYILKPFRMASLLELVDRVLNETKRQCERGGVGATERL
jgi:two-component system phosphate regulon response regulator OmpR